MNNKKLLCLGLWLLLLVMLAACEQRPGEWPPGTVAQCELNVPGGQHTVYATSIGSAWVHTAEGDMYPREQMRRCWIRE